MSDRHNFRIEVNKVDKSCWIAEIYCNSDLLKRFTNSRTKREAELQSQAFIDGIEYAMLWR